MLKMLSLPWELGGCACANSPAELPGIAQGRPETVLNGVRCLEHRLAWPVPLRPPFASPVRTI